MENSGEILETLRGFSGKVTETVMEAMKCDKENDGLLVLNHGYVQFERFLTRVEVLRWNVTRTGIVGIA